MKAVVVERSSASCRSLNGTALGCLGVIAFIYLTATCNVIVPLLGYSVHGASNLLVLSALTALAVITFLQCVFSDPGKVPAGWQPDAEQQAAAAVLQVKRSGGGKRYCKKCQAYKPPRTHHCKRCGHCVLRMDHHCVWVNNCIGHGNYRAFLLMCCYLTAAALHALGLLLTMDAHLVQYALRWDEDARLLAAAGSSSTDGSSAVIADGQSSGGPSSSSSAASKSGWHGPFWLHALVQVLATALALPVCVGLLVLFVWNAFLFLRNQTTIEYHEGVVARYLSSGGSSGSSGGRHPFDLGIHDNMHAVCGDNAACWPLPVRAAAGGDGLEFATPWDASQQQQQQH